MAQIFLCYAREDEARVRELYGRLKGLGFDLWMDKVNLIVGQRWRQEIPRALRSSSLFDEHHYFEFYPLHVVHKRSHINRKKTGTG
jgi:hypothetical protein